MESEFKVNELDRASVEKDTVKAECDVVAIESSPRSNMESFDLGIEFKVNELDRASVEKDTVIDKVNLFLLRKELFTPTTSFGGQPTS